MRILCASFVLLLAACAHTPGQPFNAVEATIPGMQQAMASEPRLIALAYAFERAAKGRVPPSAAP